MGMKLDGIGASAAVDTSGEVIDIEGLDISSLESGEGTFIYEHRNPKSDGASPLDILGAITFAKKIFDEDDCDDERQRFYWNCCGVPFLYIMGELFDDEDHEGAKAAAAVIEYYRSRKMPILLRYSIDGHTIKRGTGDEENVIKRAIARDIAITIKPCNKSCISGVVDDKPIVVAAEGDDLNKSERRLSGVEFTMAPPDESADPLYEIRVELDNLRELQAIQKAVTLGNSDVAPSELRGASALGREDLHHVKNRLKAAVRDWNGRESLKDHLQKRLPDANPEFLEKFAGLVDTYRLYKAGQLHGALDDALDSNLRKQIESAVTGLPAFDPNATNVVGSRARPKSALATPEGRAKMIANINADAARSNPEAAKVQAASKAFKDANPGAPLVDGSQIQHPASKPLIGLNTIAHINAQIASNNPEAAKIQAQPALPHQSTKDFASDIAKLPQAYNTRDESDEAEPVGTKDLVATNPTNNIKVGAVAKSEEDLSQTVKPIVYQVLDASGGRVATFSLLNGAPTIIEDFNNILVKLFPVKKTDDSLELVDQDGAVAKFQVINGVACLNGQQIDDTNLDDIRNKLKSGELRLT